MTQNVIRKSSVTNRKLYGCYRVGSESWHAKQRMSRLPSNAIAQPKSLILNKSRKMSCN